MRLVQTIAMECTVCRQVRDHDQVMLTSVDAALFGAAKGAVCPACCMPVDERTSAYMRRAHRYLGLPAPKRKVWISSICEHKERVLLEEYEVGDSEPCVHCPKDGCVATVAEEKL